MTDIDLNTQRHVIIDIGMHTLEGFIDIDADVDGVFRFFCTDTDETLYVSGWLMDSIEDVDPGRSCCNGCGCDECAHWDAIEAVAAIVERTPTVAWGMDR